MTVHASLVKFELSSLLHSFSLEVVLPLECTDFSEYRPSAVLHVYGLLDLIGRVAGYGNHKWKEQENSP